MGKYDDDGNILDVEIFIIKPKIDNRIMTKDDEKRWLTLNSEPIATDLVVNNLDLDGNENKQRRKISEEEEVSQESKERLKRKKSLVERSSEVFKKIEFKKPSFLQNINM